MNAREMCPSCYMPSSAYDSEIGTCSWCDADLPDTETDPFSNIKCQHCGNKITFGDHACEFCGSIYSQEEWDQIEAVLIVAQFNDVRKAPVKNPVLDDEDTICCNRNWLNCTCEKSYFWDDTTDIPAEETNEAYEYTSECSGCEFYYTEQCLPFRQWCFEWLKHAERPNPIDFCSNYLAWLEADRPKDAPTPNLPVILKGLDSYE